jgi:hypothetical protein
MATNRDLLKEAIADAKAVKEMAIANAKAALEEVFTPQLQSMLSAKLQEMEEEEETMEEGEEGFGDMDPKGHGNIKDDSSLYEDEDMDLEELLKELDEDIEDVEGYEDTDADGIEDDSDADSGEEGISLDLEDMTDEDLKKFIEDVISDMFESGELEANHEASESEEEEEAEHEEGGSEEGEEEEEEINLDELLAEIEEMEGDDLDEYAEMQPSDYPGMEDDKDLDEYAEMQPSDYPGMENGGDKISKLEAELESALDVIRSLREDLNEVNLLNAKLLYTNKIFKSKNLTESQKLNVLSSFDKATTVKETKLVYETLSEGIKSKTNRISENLGSASKGIGTTKTKQPIVESNEMVARFQKLAGIN